MKNAQLKNWENERIQGNIFLQLSATVDTVTATGGTVGKCTPTCGIVCNNGQKKVGHLISIILTSYSILIIKLFI